MIVGHPASAGRATGPVHIVHGPSDFDGFGDGQTVPVREGDRSREAPAIRQGRGRRHRRRHPRRPCLPGRPRVRNPSRVETGDATTRLSPGQLVTVDGAAGTVTLHEPKADQA